MVGIGIVGIGFMGMIHYLAAAKLSGAKAVALCSRDPKKLAGDWTSIQGNFGPRGTQMDLSGQKGYADVGELLAGEEALDRCEVAAPEVERELLRHEIELGRVLDGGMVDAPVGKRDFLGMLVAHRIAPAAPSRLLRASGGLRTLSTLAIAKASGQFHCAFRSGPIGSQQGSN